MKRTLTIVFALLLLSTTISLADKVNKTLLGGVAIKGYDPVAYFVDGGPQKGDKKIDFEWQGATWRFANEDNLARFKAEPERYAPQYGGYCAWAVSQGYTANIDPQAWTIHDDKLYLNYNKDVQEKWNADRDGFIVKADENWPEIRDK